MVLLEKTCDESELEVLARELISLFEVESEIVVWLRGDMGAGKTALVRRLLWNWGLDERVPVLSPTYTLMNEYEIENKWVAHLDLYRVDDSFTMDEVGIFDLRKYRAIFIEWPQTAPSSEVFPATHLLDISPVENGKKRSYLLQKC